MPNLAYGLLFKVVHRDFYHNEKVSELRSSISDIRNELILSEIREELLQSRIELNNKKTDSEDTITNITSRHIFCIKKIFFRGKD